MNAHSFTSARGLIPLFVLAAAVCSPSLAKDLVLEDSQSLAAVDMESGALTRLESKSTRWIIERRPELGMSFRLFAPLPHRRDNFILGQKQRAAEVTRTSRNEVRMRWKDLTSEHGGVLPITVTATISLTNGALTFAATLQNDSPVTVETMDYPCLGDLNPPAPDSSLQARTMWYGNLQSHELYPSFSNEKGYWGVDFPTKTFDSHHSLFCLIQAPQAGLYVEMHDPTQPYLLEYTFEQHPGLISGFNNRVPRTATRSPACRSTWSSAPAISCLLARAFAVTLAPVVVRAYTGDWHAGVDLYKEWRATWFKPPHLPDWAREVHSWTMLRMNTPEEDYPIPYTNLVQYGEEYASNGVSAVQLVGWNIGGQDRDDPSQDTDPGWARWQELHDAIAQVQAKGVKVILFGKLGWADRRRRGTPTSSTNTPATDPYGIPYEQGGYSYVTPTQLAGINNRRRAVMDFLCPAYRDIATEEFQKILALGAAGWLLDEVCHHGSGFIQLCPGPRLRAAGLHLWRRPAAGRAIARRRRQGQPRFPFRRRRPAGLADAVLPGLRDRRSTRCRSASILIPHCLMLAGVSGFDDRETLNLILLQHYFIQYEPYYYKGHLTDFPLTLAYGKKIDALRRKYKAYLWDAEFRDTLGAKVSANGSSRYSVFVHREANAR